MKTCKSKRFISLILLMTIAWSCENVKEYTDPKDNIPPGKVTDVEVENLHGGAMITYTLPQDKDLLGVKAVYSLREDGKEYEVYSSAYRDTIILAGFPDTNEHVVNLYAIDQSRNVSEPVPVTIKPLTPPVDIIRQSFKVQEAFGGIYCSWENIMNENIAISLYVDSIGELILDDTYFSSASDGRYSFRGFPSKEYSFRIEIRDRWLNYAAPLDTVLTPIFEEQIMPYDDMGRQMWTMYGVGDQSCLSRGDWPYPVSGNFTMAFDGIFTNNFNMGSHWGNLIYHIPGWQSRPNYFVRPAYCIFDMGRKAKYSRFIHWMNLNQTPLGAGSSNWYIIDFSLWGTNDPKPILEEHTDEDRIANLQYWTSWPEIDGTDAWKNDWVKLGDYSLVYPSGKIMFSDVPFTAEDVQFIRDGFNAEIDTDKTNLSFRYLRFESRKSNNLDGIRQVWHLGEIQFFGSYDDE